MKNRHQGRLSSSWVRHIPQLATHPIIGFEEEYFICRTKTGAATSALKKKWLKELQRHIHTQYTPPTDDTFSSVHAEVFSCQVELASGVHGNIEIVSADFRRMREELQQAFAARDLFLLARGTHPTADWAKLAPPVPHRMPHVQTFAGRRLLTCGFHIHVGFADTVQLFAFFQFVRPFLPLFLALGASSRDWRGIDTGSHSARHTVFASVRHGGVPPVMDASEFARFRESIRENPLLPDERDQPSWLVRPSIYWPTVEVRVMDANPDLERNLDIAAMIQALARLANRRLTLSGRPGRVRPKALRGGGMGGFVTGREPSWLIADNLWRVEKSGLEADFLYPETDSPYTAFSAVRLRDFGLDWLKRLDKDFARLGTAPRRERLIRILSELPSSG